MRSLLFSLGALAACTGAEPPALDDVVVALDPFTIAPGTDQVFCQYLPADGAEHWLSGFTTDMTPGSHHLLVFRVDESKGMVPAAGRHTCDQLELPPGVDGMLPGSQQPHTDVALPAGIAMRLGPQHGLFFQFHYVNGSDAPLEATITWRATATDPAAVTDTAGMMFYSNFDLQVPPGRSVATQHCTLPYARTLLGATGHMHRRGVAFDAATDDAVLYHASSWTEPPLTAFDPPLELPKGARVTWSCTYENPDATTYVFGPSATDNEMCIFAAIYYPAPDSATDFGCDP